MPTRHGDGYEKLEQPTLYGQLALKLMRRLGLPEVTLSSAEQEELAVPEVVRRRPEDHDVPELFDLTYRDPAPATTGKGGPPTITRDEALDRVNLLWRKAGRGRPDLDSHFQEALVGLMLALFREGYERGQVEPGGDAGTHAPSEVLLVAARAAKDALRSYQYGNSAIDLAKDTADALDAAIEAVAR